MKLVRKIKPVSFYDDCDDENNNALTLDDLDSEPGFYKNVIRPMLAPGHEGELINWLKAIGLLPQTQRCKNAGNNDGCKGPMCWIPAKRVDNFQWKCLGCSEKRTIREDSVFQQIKCNFKDAIRILLGWCKGNDMEAMAKLLSTRKQVVNTIYNISAKTADRYLRSHLFEWKLGGPGVVVIVAVYPQGFEKLQNQDHRQYGTTPILCLAEVKEIPTRYWFEVLDNCNTKEQIKTTNEVALQIIRNMVLPGSNLVTELNSKVCSYYTLQSLRHLYPIIVSTDALQRHDTANQVLLNNLEMVWRPALDICEEAQCFPYSQIQHYLINQLWMQKFGQESLEMLLHQLCYP